MCVCRKHLELGQSVSSFFPSSSPNALLFYIFITFRVCRVDCVNMQNHHQVISVSHHYVRHPVNIYLYLRKRPRKDEINDKKEKLMNEMRTQWHWYNHMACLWIYTFRTRISKLIYNNCYSWNHKRKWEMFNENQKKLKYDKCFRLSMGPIYVTHNSLVIFFHRMFGIPLMRVLVAQFKPFTHFI